jgi:hypothetical protein
MTMQFDAIPLNLDRPYVITVLLHLRNMCAGVLMFNFSLKIKTCNELTNM